MNDELLEMREQTHDRLPRYFDEILYIVVLMLLESGEQHVHNRVLVIPHFLTFSLFLLRIFNLQ